MSETSRADVFDQLLSSAIQNFDGLSGDINHLHKHCLALQRIFHADLAKFLSLLGPTIQEDSLLRHEEMCLFVLHSVLESEAKFRGHTLVHVLPRALRWIQRMFAPAIKNSSSALRQDDQLVDAAADDLMKMTPTLSHWDKSHARHLTDLPTDILLQIAPYFGHHERNSASLTSNTLRDVVIRSDRRLVPAWALATLKTLGLSLEQIIYALMRLHHEHEQLASSIIRSFSQHDTMGFEIEVKSCRKSLCDFVSLFAQHEYVWHVRIIFSSLTDGRSVHKSPEAPRSIKLMFDGSSMTGLEPLLEWMEQACVNQSPPRFTVHLRQNLQKSLKDPFLYLLCTSIRASQTQESTMFETLMSLLSQLDRMQRGAEQYPDHVPKILSLMRLEEIDFHSSEEQGSWPSVVLPTSLRRVILRFKGLHRSIWFEALALPQLRQLVLTNAPFSDPYGRLKDIRASRLWSLIHLESNQLTNEHVNQLLEVKTAHGHGAHVGSSAAGERAASNLTTLRLRQNALTSARPHLRFDFCDRLQKLDVSHNDNLGEGLLCAHLPKTLEELFARECGIQIPDPEMDIHTEQTRPVFDLKKKCPILRLLDLSKNPGIAYLGVYLAPETLRTLNVESCSLVRIDPAFKDSRLQILIINFNANAGEKLKSEHLPASLKELFAKKCGLKLADSALDCHTSRRHVQFDFKHSCPALSSLDLEENEGIAYVSADQAPRTLHILKLGYCSLTAVHPTFRSSHLRKLDINYNKKLGKKLSAENLPITLEELSAKNCGIEIAIPWPWIGAPPKQFNFRQYCPVLAALDLSDNKGINYLGGYLGPATLRLLTMTGCGICKVDPSLRRKNLKIVA